MRAPERAECTRRRAWRATNSALRVRSPRVFLDIHDVRTKFPCIGDPFPSNTALFQQPVK